MKIAITGCAGFIGSHLSDFFLSKGYEVLGLDNFSTGQKHFIEKAEKNAKFQLKQVELLDYDATLAALTSFRPDWVVHLAANADVREGLKFPRRDLEQGTTVTFNVLEASRLSGAKKFAYSSTGSVYGEAPVFPTPEDCPFPIQTSLYAASKLAGEGLVQAYAEGYGLKGYIFRFVSILGERYTHGHVFDFAKKLIANPHSIEVLGNGLQRKAYLYVHDCISAIWTVLSTQEEKIQIFNLGPEEWCTVNDSLDVICQTMKLSPERHYTGGERGWIGDSPFIFLDTKRICSLGWKPTKNIRESVKITLEYLLENRWLLEARKQE